MSTRAPLRQRRRCRVVGWLAFALAAQGDAVGASPPVAESLPAEIRRALSHSPIPDVPIDPANEVQQLPEAIRFGALLFDDIRLSGGKGMSCATCHQPGNGWSDGRPVPGDGGSGGVRRTPSIRNAAHQRWFGWDGGADSLWFQAIRPIENPVEMGMDRLEVARLVSSSPDLAATFLAVFGPAAADRCTAGGDPATPVQVRREAATDCLRNVGKALAAFIATIVSRPNRFDRFVEHVKGGGPVDRSGLCAEELAGLRLFFGKGNCHACHAGPLFTNGEFHNLGLYPTVKGGWKDSGRLGGVRRLIASEFNRVRSAESLHPPENTPSRYLAAREHTWGQFKTPSLRNASSQSYFMHHGHFSSLQQVVRFYSELEGLDATDHHRELSIMPLRLTPAEQGSLVRFLELIGE
jgi:cytochrome c peroxidase